MKYRILIFLSVGGVLILYLSLRPSPLLSEIGWLPGWLGAWADQHGDLRTGVPFLMISTWMALEVAWAFRGSKLLPVFIWLLGVVGLITLLGLVEVIQIWMPRRIASWADIAWGTAGAMVGGWPLLFAGLLKRDGAGE